MGRWRPGSVFTKGIRDQGMEIECRDGKNALRLSVTFLWSPTGHELPSDTDRGALDYPWPRLEWKRLDRPDTQWSEVSRDGPLLSPSIGSMASCLRSAELLSLEVSNLTEPSYSEQPRPRIGRDGEGLASVLAFLALNQPERFESLQAHLRSIIPSVERIRFDRVPVSRIETETVTIDRGESHEASEEGLRW